MKTNNDFVVRYFKALKKYHKDLSNRLSLNQDPEVASYVDSCIKKEHKFLKEFEEKGLLSGKNLIDKTTILSIKNEVDSFIENQVNLNPIRKPQGNYVVPSDSKESTKEYLEDLTELASKTPTVSIKDPLVNVENLTDLVFNEEVISKITAYFKTLPMVTFVKVVKHFPNEFQSSVNDWHVDGPPDSIGSARLLKVIYYLDDIIDLDKGPYCYVEGSHLDRITYNKRSFNDKEITEYYGNDKIKEAYACMGDAIFTRGELIHKAGKPTSQPRTLVIINYCIHEEYLDTPGIDFEVDKIKIKTKDINKLKFKALADNLITV